MPESSEERPPAGNVLGPNVAGTWYQGDPDLLRREIDSFLSACDENGGKAAGSGARGTPLAVVVPHAGLVYSGAIAGRGFRALAGLPFSRAIVIGPSHHAAFDGAAVPEAGEYRTPLGSIPLDSDAIETLRPMPGIRVDDGPFRPEHCLEMELPFLQQVLPAGWRLLPVLIGAGSSVEARARVAEALRPWTGPESVIVVSSDFTHFGPRFGYVPFKRSVSERIRELDMGAVDRILERDSQRFEEYVNRTGATICGRAAIDVMLRLLRPEARGSLVAYDTSGRMTGDWQHSVSYAGILFRDPA